MNPYDEKYDIRIANRDDIDAIMAFINDNWRKNHIMAVDRQLFEHEFLEEDGTVNFILAIDREKGTIEALNGILKASQDSEHLDLFGSFWKALDGNMAFLGLEIIKRKKEMFGARNTIGVGDNPNTAIPLLKVLKVNTDKMSHFYILADREEYKIAKVVNKNISSIRIDSEYNVIEFFNRDEVTKNFDFDKYKDNVPYKDSWYIGHRFFDYPIYKYHVYGIEKKGTVEALIVIRRQEHNGRIAIRIVDYIGEQEAIKGIGLFINRLLNEPQVEYIDFYCCGFNEVFLLDTGFVKKIENDENIIPNFFSPYVLQNIDIHVSSSAKNTLFTKADADQDRPN